MLRRAILATAFLSCLAALVAQPAPRETVSVDLGGKTIAIEYGRPALQGRSFNDLLGQLPPDRMWRAGADQVTTLIAETAFRVGDKVVPAGRYSVYLHCPEGGPYSLVLNKVVGQPLRNVWSEAPADIAEMPVPHFQYENEIGDQEVARVPMRKESVGEPVDLFAISLDPAGSGATLRMAWGTESWSVNLLQAPREGS
jgi:hypothetical protein